MQASHQPDIENIKGVIARLTDCKRPARRGQSQEFPMQNRELPAISQMDFKWCERLGIIVLPDRFNCHANSYSIDGHCLQPAVFSS